MQGCASLQRRRPTGAPPSLAAGRTRPACVPFRDCTRSDFERQAGEAACCPPAGGAALRATDACPRGGFLNSLKLGGAPGGRNVTADRNIPIDVAAVERRSTTHGRRRTEGHRSEGDGRSYRTRREGTARGRRPVNARVFDGVEPPACASPARPASRRARAACPPRNRRTSNPPTPSERSAPRPQYLESRASVSRSLDPQ